MTNSLVRIGTVGVDWVKRAQSVLIRPSSHQQRRRTFSSATPVVVRSSIPKTPNLMLLSYEKVGAAVLPEVVYTSSEQVSIAIIQKWDALLYRHGLHDDLHVEAMLDKTIRAMSSVFIGSSGSTFTEDILRLRKDWGPASGCDEYICQGELPDFIADNE